MCEIVQESPESQNNPIFFHSSGETKPSKGRRVQRARITTTPRNELYPLTDEEMNSETQPEVLSHKNPKIYSSGDAKTPNKTARIQGLVENCPLWHPRWDEGMPSPSPHTSPSGRMLPTSQAENHTPAPWQSAQVGRGEPKVHPLSPSLPDLSGIR